MAYNQVVLQDFSGGLNDTVPPTSVGDGQLTISENTVYADDVKAIRSRKGCIKLNADSFGAEITDAYGWLVGSTYKKLVVMNSKVYEFHEDGSLTEKLTLQNGAQQIYPFTYYNRLYFGDGTEIYEWGGSDFTTDSPVDDLRKDQIVKCNSDKNGTEGHYYQYIGDNTSDFVFTKADYKDTTKWKDVTDVRYYSSNVVRKMERYDGSEKEEVRINITSRATKTGNVELYFDGKTYKAIIDSTSYSIASIAQKIVGAVEIDEDGNEVTVTSKDSSGEDTTKKSILSDIEGWDISTIAIDAGYQIIFKAKESGAHDNGTIDDGGTGITLVYRTVTEGVNDDCTIENIKKCTMFCVYIGNARVFASGNPDDQSAVYYSAIGQPNYFRDKVDVIYPSVNGVGKVTAMLNFSGYLLVSYTDGWYAWSGTTALDDAKWQPLNIPYGCIAPRSVCLTPYSMTFLSKKGIYRVLMSILYYEIALVQTKGVIKDLTESRVENAIADIEDIENCEAIYYNDTYYLSYKAKGDTGRQHVLQYEWNVDAWSITTGWKVNRFISDPYNLVFASKNYVLQAETGYSDVDVNTGKEKPIQFHVQTKEYTFGTPFTNKNLQMIGFMWKQFELLDSTATVLLHDGSNKTFDVTDELLNQNLAYARKWERMWGHGETVVQTAEIIDRATSFQCEIKSSQLNNPLTLVGLGFIYKSYKLLSPHLEKDDLLLE